MVSALSRLMLLTALLLALPAFAVVETAMAQSSLKKCPDSQNVRWHSCFGVWAYAKGNNHLSS